MAISASSNLMTPDVVVTSDASAPSVSWGAIFAGAAATTALSLILFVLGSGLGLAMVSPWTASGVGITTFAVSTAIWLVVVQWLSAGVGGYLAGRLRAKWDGLHTDETFFRDTAHGFVTWAISTLLVAGLLGSAVSSAVGGGASAVTSVVSGAAQGAGQGAASQADNSGNDNSMLPTDYFVDTLFRPSDTSPAAGNAQPNIGDSKSEAWRILVQGATNGSIPDQDKTQLARLISNNTGMSDADAKARVDQVLAQIDTAKVKAKEATDKARKAGAMISIMAFLSLLIGAFIASTAAAYGGRLRDDYR